MRQILKDYMGDKTTRHVEETEELGLPIGCHTEFPKKLVGGISLLRCKCHFLEDQNAAILSFTFGLYIF